MYYDPRFVRLDDAPAIIEVKSGVRLSFFTRNPSKYMNIRELIDICNLEYESGEHQSYIDSIYGITGIQTNVSSPINKQELTVKKYYGWYEMGQEGEDGDGSGEKLYEFRTVDDAIVVYSKEITQIPFGVIKCFEDTDTFLATGFLESIMGMKDEMNFKKNRASDYINQATNRSYFYSPNSGINPKHLISKP